MLLQRLASSVPDGGHRAGLVLRAGRNRVGQERADPVMDLAGDVRLRLRAGDDQVTVRFRVGESAESPAYALVELPRLGLDPVGGRGEPREPAVGGHVLDDRQVRDEPAGGPPVDVGYLSDLQLAPGALVGE